MPVHSSHVAAVGQVHHDHVIVVTDRHALAAHEYWPPGGNSVMCMSCFSVSAACFLPMFFEIPMIPNTCQTIPLRKYVNHIQTPHLIHLHGCDSVSTSF